MTKKRKNLLITLLIIYSIAVIYCMFFGFNRVQGIDTYRFQLVPNKWPLIFPMTSSPNTTLPTFLTPTTKSSSTNNRWKEVGHGAIFPRY